MARTPTWPSRLLWAWCGGAATALGLWLGPKVGPRRSLALPALVSGDRKPAHTDGRFSFPARRWACWSVWPHHARSSEFAPGLAAAGVNTLGDLQPLAWQGLLASFYGAIAGELLLRLGLMTLLVWAGARLTRTSAFPRPS